MALRARPLIVSAAALALAVAGCRTRHDKKPATPAVSAVAEPIGTHGGRKAADQWVPAEFKKGAARWKDTGVYVDGKPIGMLSFGELPVGLEPVWIEGKVSAEKNYGDDNPGYRIVKQRNYRFTDYLKAVGVDLKRLKELHVYGPQLTEVIVVSGKELRQRGAGFLFRFGSDVFGKAIPVVPPNFGNGVQPDKISLVTAYVRRQPPRLVPDEGMEIDGEIVDGVPYYGEPLRGGVRVYVDDRLTTIIKRNQLQEAGELAAAGPDGHLRFNFFGFLEARGVDTRKIVEGWIVRHDRRRERLTREQLQSATFEAGTQAKGEITIGDPPLHAQSLTLHTKHVTPPEILPDEDPSDLD